MKVRSLLERLQPYEWEPSTESLAASLGLDPNRIVRFDTSTPPYPPRRWMRILASQLEGARVNDYPDASYSALRRSLSRYVGVGEDQVTMSNGGDEALDIIAKAFIDQGSQAVVSSPTYSLYRILVEVMGGRTIEVPRLPDFGDDAEALLRASRGDARLLVLCSPNNPTANTASKETVLTLLERSGCAVAVDEAYYEFCGKTFAGLTKKYENLIVVRSFSKAFGLAGARVGYIVAHEDTIRMLNKVRPPNSLGVVSLLLAQIALDDLQTVRRNVERMIDERDRCIRFLKRVKGVHVFPSEANFLLVRFKRGDAGRAHAALLRKGFVTRSLRDTPGLEDCLRFGVRLPKENDALLRAIAELAG